MRYKTDRKRFNATMTYSFEDIEFTTTPCTYCGDPAREREHVAPLAVTQYTEADWSSEYPTKIVPACRECNRIASDHTFRTLSAKREFIHAKLRKRYRRCLETPAWTQEELAELGWTLRSHIQHMLAKQRILRRRLSWPSVRSAASSSDSSDPGNALIESNAATPTTFSDTDSNEQ